MTEQQKPQPAPPLTTSKPTIIGIYGVPSCGKSYHLQNLREELGHSDNGFTFLDGSELIDQVVPEGLEAFKKLSPKQKTQYRELAIETFGQECADSG